MFGFFYGNNCKELIFNKIADTRIKKAFDRINNLIKNKHKN